MEDLIRQLRECGVQNDAEVNEKEPVQQDKLIRKDAVKVLQMVAG